MKAAPGVPKQGDEIQVKRPSVFTANAFPAGGSITVQDLNQCPVFVTMDEIADVSVEITAREMALDFDGFNEEVLDPAVVAIAEDLLILGGGHLVVARVVEVGVLLDLVEGVEVAR